MSKQVIFRDDYPKEWQDGRQVLVCNGYIYGHKTDAGNWYVVTFDCIEDEVNQDFEGHTESWYIQDDPDGRYIAQPTYYTLPNELKFPISEFFETLPRP